jgi:hypothetical protein
VATISNLPFGGTASFSNSFARRVAASSISSSPIARSDQLYMIRTGDPLRLAAVDQMLASPVVDRLIIDLELHRKLSDLPASSQQIEHFATKL